MKKIEEPEEIAPTPTLIPGKAKRKKITTKVPKVVKGINVTNAVLQDFPDVKPLVEYIYKYKQISKGVYTVSKKIGVMIGKLNPYTKNVNIGFSLCHNTKDRYDYVKGIHKPGFGLKMAAVRSGRWANRCYYDSRNIFDDDFEDVVHIPASIQYSLFLFIRRCGKFFINEKDEEFRKLNAGRTLPEWTIKFLEDFSK